MGVSENWGGTYYFGVLMIRILLFGVPYIRVPYFWKPPHEASGLKLWLPGLKIQVARLQDSRSKGFLR